MSYPVAQPASTALCPRTKTCCFCISLRLGVYLIALFDTAFSFLKAIGCILIIAQPRILPSTPDPMGDGDTATEFDLGEARTTLLLSIGTCYFGFRGALSIRTCDPEGLRPYLNWKVFQVVMTMILSAMAHRVWWNGCGVLSPGACADLKGQLVLGALLGAVPGFYFIWKIWSLYSMLDEGDEFELYSAGYNAEDLDRLHTRSEAKRHQHAQAQYPFHGMGPGGQEGPVQPNTTYLV